MRVRFEVIADIAVSEDASENAGEGIDLGKEELEDFALEIERIIDCAFRKNPWATYEHTRLSLFGVEVSPVEEKAGD